MLTKYIYTIYVYYCILYMLCLSLSSIHLKILTSLPMFLDHDLGH